jgi:hypothetical protein
MSSLALELPKEINRVRAVQDTYKELRSMPNVIVEPQIMMMEHAIQSAISATASGDVVAMLQAYEALKGWQE